MNSKISEKGQVTIPKKLREQLGISAGDTLDFEEERGRIVVTKVISRDPVDELYGVLDLGKRTDAFLAELRGTAEPE